jgi:autotransporter translocation and assembly factor TamB
MKAYHVLLLAIVGAFFSQLTTKMAFGYQQPSTHSVHSVTGFYEKIYNGPVTSVPLMSDTGTVDLLQSFEKQDLGIKSIGDLRYSSPNDGQMVYEPIYDYHGPYFDLSYATIGWWEIVRDTPYAWGMFAAGSSENFSLPTKGAATYCGFWDAWTNSGGLPGINSMGNEGVLVQTSFQHAPPLDHATINTFTIANIGATTSGAIAIEDNGTSTVTFRTVGPNGLLNGTATALVHFYGPNAIQLSATFSGPWDGRYRLAGAFWAQLVPGNPGRCD